MKNIEIYKKINLKKDFYKTKMFKKTTYTHIIINKGRFLKKKI